MWNGHSWPLDVSRNVKLPLFWGEGFICLLSCRGVGFICLLYICIFQDLERKLIWFAQFNGGFICLLYICIVQDLERNLIWFAQLTGGFICLLYICIVQDLERNLIWFAQLTRGVHLPLVSMFSLCTGISLYFLISWLFQMGSHWWHWKA